MVRSEDMALLEWWANESTCLTLIPVMVTTSASPGEWEAVIPPPFDHDAREDLQLLLDADPYFTLRFDASAINVQAEDFDGLDRMRLIALPQPQPPGGPA
ncbi:hypothetical protein ACQB60_32135 [Actinomycetota bacterium Odt1-20B]